MTLVRPTYLASREVPRLDDFIGGLGIAQPPRISLEGDRFTLLDETGMVLAEPDLRIKIIIVAANKNSSRVYYDKSKPYDRNNREAPLCWSDNGIGPSKNCSMPQAPTCSSCPNAVWGSAIGLGGKGIPACGSYKKIGVMVSGREEIFLLSIPPASLSNWTKYISTLAKIPASPEEIITVVKMENKELIFEYTSWVPEELMPEISKLIEDDVAGSIVNRFDEARDPSAFQAMVNTANSLASPSTAQVEVVATEAFAASASATPPVRKGRPPGSLNKPKMAIAPPVQPMVESPATAPEFAKAQFSAPPGFGFGDVQAPDPKVEGFLADAFKLPRRT